MRIHWPETEVTDEEKKQKATKLGTDAFYAKPDLVRAHTHATASIVGGDRLFQTTVSGKIFIHNIDNNYLKQNGFDPYRLALAIIGGELVSGETEIRVFYGNTLIDATSKIILKITLDQAISLLKSCGGEFNFDDNTLLQACEEYSSRIKDIDRVWDRDRYIYDHDIVDQLILILQNKDGSSTKAKTGSENDSSSRTRLEQDLAQLRVDNKELKNQIKDYAELVSQLKTEIERLKASQGNNRMDSNSGLDSLLRSVGYQYTTAQITGLPRELRLKEIGILRKRFGKMFHPDGGIWQDQDRLKDINGWLDNLDG